MALFQSLTPRPTREFSQFWLPIAITDHDVSRSGLYLATGFALLRRSPKSFAERAEIFRKSKPKPNDNRVNEMVSHMSLISGSVHPIIRDLRATLNNNSSADLLVTQISHYERPLNHKRCVSHCLLLADRRTEEL